MTRLVLGRSWADVPRSLQFVVGAQVVVLAYGGFIHVVQLIAGGLHPYSWAPPWLAIYFTSLTLADPLAAALLWARRASGLYLGVAVFVTDALANGYAVLVRDESPVVARISLVLISVLAVASVALAPRLRPWLLPRPDRARAG